MISQDRAPSGVNGTGTDAKIDTPLTQPRSLSDLRSFLHGYRIKNTSAINEPNVRASRASVIIRHIDEGKTSPHMHRAAHELAALDPSLSWLPAWKPRVSVRFAKGDAT